MGKLFSKTSRSRKIIGDTLSSPEMGTSLTRYFSGPKPRLVVKVIKYFQLLEVLNKTPSVTRRNALRTAFFAGATALGLASCSRDNKTSSKQSAEKPATGSTFAFDTYCTFTVYGDGDALAKLSEACQHFDALFDLYDDESDIARINAGGGRPVTVDSDTVDLVTRALDFCEQADGRFDITIGAVSTLWDFDEGVSPTDEQIAAALPHVNWHNVIVDEAAGTVQLTDPQAKLDLGGIAKGFVADRLCELLRTETKATAAVISLGGNGAFYGKKPGGGTWDTGIRDPNDPGGNTTVGTAHVSGGSLVTSGLYERTFELDGVTYWHILDPRTGMPVQTDTESVTVACPSSTTADALSTTLFVSGSREGSAIAEAHEDTAAYFLLQGGGTAESPRWQELTDFES